MNGASHACAQYTVRVGRQVLDTRTHTRAHTHHTQTHAHTRTPHTDTRTHTCAHTCTHHTYTHTHTHKHTHRCSHAHTPHTDTRTHTHAHTHTRTHTHTQFSHADWVPCGNSLTALNDPVGPNHKSVSSELVCVVSAKLSEIDHRSASPICT